MSIVDRKIYLAGVIATRDRPKDIKRLMESVADLDRPNNLRFRLIVVDNSSEGNLEDFLSAEAVGCPLSYVHEPAPGLSRARNAGVALARGHEWMFLVDDDCLLPRDFLVRVRNAVESHPNAGVIGGRVELFDPTDLPICINTSRELAYYGEGTGTALFGFMQSCYVIPKKCIDEVGLFDIHLGSGSPVHFADDSDFLYRAWRAGYQVVYDPDLYLYHNHGRKDPSVAAQLMEGWWMGQGAFFCKHVMAGDLHAIKMLYWDARSSSCRHRKLWACRLRGASLFLRDRLRVARPRGEL